ncbi:MAG TPA: FG-GAP-like repeat-containing protein, partial [Nitrospiria bacterium]|nr:FG-GAP-like repeat-containing protein [Nitrospiria bacterium]
TFNAGEADAGKVYLYLGSAKGLSKGAVWSVGSRQEGEQFGVEVASGDVNGDGFSDVAVGAVGYVENKIRTGKVYLYLGGPRGPSSTPDWTTVGEQKGGASFGAGLSFGDVNGDGFADLLVGANGFPSGKKAGAGKIYLYFGSKEGPSNSYVWSSTGDDAPHASFGYPVLLFDLDGDRMADLLVSAIGFYGKTFFFPGSARPSPRPLWTSIGEKEGGALFGSAVAAGDVNGDGYFDLAVGAYAMDNPGKTDSGKLYLFEGSADGLPSEPVWTAIGDDREDAFYGFSAVMGDVNGDGYADLLVGAQSQTETVVNAGKAFLYLGSPKGFSAPAWTSVGANVDHAFFGTAVALGDFNGDGANDLVVSAPLQGTEEKERVGAVYVYLGRKETGPPH